MAKKLGVCLERRSVRNYVLTKAAEEKERLRVLLKDRFVFLKMDACTRHRVNYFAIDARFVNDDGEPCTQTLAVRDTHADHTSEFMQKLVEQVMAEFGIDKDQVLIIVTDNASNMVSMMERMNAKRDLGEDDDTDDDPNTFVIDDQTDEEMNKLTQIIDAAYFPIQHMRCAVHTLQLAIRDGLKNQHASTFIAKVRQVATAARTPKIDAILKRRAGKGAIIDQATRWGSTYLMVERLLELKSYIQDLANEDLTLRDNQWDELLELKATLLFPYCVTKKLQSEHLTPATFFKEWKGLVFQLSNRGGLIAEGIVQSMKRRETVLLSCPLILAGIYVDPNTQLLLTPEKKEEARQQMVQMATRLDTRREESQRVNECSSVSDGPSTSSSSTTTNPAIDSGPKEFEDFLDQIEDGPTQQIVLPHQSEREKRRKKFEDGLKGLEFINRSMKLSFEEALALYNEDVAIVARLVSAMPTTQVSVERLFSSLRIIKSDLRASMKEDLVEAILFLRVRD